MGLVDQSWVLSWRDVFGVGGLLFFLVGLTVALTVARKPHLFWPLLLVVNVFANGPRVRVYIVLDEILTGFIVAGAVLRIMMVKADGAPDRQIDFRGAVYLLWIGYMILHAGIGAVALDDLRMIRWVIFYAVLGVLLLVVYFRGSEFRFPSSRGASLIIQNTAIVYFLVYLAQGMIAEYLLGAHGRFLTQDRYWAGSAYAVFPMLLAVPAAILLMNDQSRWVRLHAWISVGLMMTVAFYYDSRMSWLVMIGLFGVSWRCLKIRRMTAAAAVFVIVATLLVERPMERIASLFEELFNTSRALVVPYKTDVGRVLHIQAGVSTAMASWHGFVFGSGYYTHRFLMVPDVKERLKWYLPEQDMVIPGTRDDRDPAITVIRTQGFPALLVDTGVVGVGLLVLTAMLAMHSVLRVSTANRASMVAVILMAVLWLLSNNILDIVLFHLLLIPGGLVEQWHRAVALEERSV